MGLNQAGSELLPTASDGASQHVVTTMPCMLCKQNIDPEHDEYVPVYVEFWLIGNVHDTCYQSGLMAAKIVGVDGRTGFIPGVPPR